MSLCFLTEMTNRPPQTPPPNNVLNLQATRQNKPSLSLVSRSFTAMTNRRVNLPTLSLRGRETWHNLSHTGCLSQLPASHLLLMRMRSPAPTLSGATTKQSYLY